MSPPELGPPGPGDFPPVRVLVILFVTLLFVAAALVGALAVLGLVV